MNEIPDINKRIKELVAEFSAGNVQKFVDLIGVSHQVLNRIFSIDTRSNKYPKPSGLILTAIQTKLPQVSTAWLLTGEGEMLKNNRGITALSYEVPLLPTSAQGGTLNDFVVSVKDSDCEKVISPIKGAEYAMPVAGDSMSPEYPSGSQILIKRINEKAFIDWGKVYVLDTCNGTVIKKLMPPTINDKETVRCVSINPEYPPFEVKLCDVYGVYKVLLCMSIK